MSTLQSSSFSHEMVQIVLGVPPPLPLPCMPQTPPLHSVLSLETVVHVSPFSFFVVVSPASPESVPASSELPEVPEVLPDVEPEVPDVPDVDPEEPDELLPDVEPPLDEPPSVSSSPRRDQPDRSDQPRM